MNDHLTPMAREYLLLPTEERALKCCRDVWIAHPYGISATECVKQLVAWPRVMGNPAMAVVGSPGVGKSALAQRWSDESFSGKGGWAGKVLYIDMSNREKGSDLEKRLLQELGMRVRGRPYTFSAKDYAEAQAAVIRLNIRAVIFDEVHGLDQRMSKQRLHNMFQAMKGFTNRDWGLNVILCGITELRDLLVKDPQISSRYAPRTIELPDWKNNNIFASFVASFMCTMPLMRKSEVTSTEFLATLYDLAKPDVSESKERVDKNYRKPSGNSPLRTILDIMKEACRYAVISGEEYIDVISIRNAVNRFKGITDARDVMLQNQRIAVADSPE